MSSPVKLYHQEMHKNVGYFATWLPTSPIELGDIGVLEEGRFRRVASLKELGIQLGAIREGTPENMSYSASAKIGGNVSTAAGTPLPAAAELAIQFMSRGGFVFESLGMQNVEIADRMALAESVLKSYEKGHWQKNWLLVEALYRAESATIIVSEESASEIVLKATSSMPLGSIPLADPKLGLTVSSSHGKLVHIMAKDNLHPLYSCVRVRDSVLFGGKSVAPVRGAREQDRIRSLTRPAVEELLES